MEITKKIHYPPYKEVRVGRGTAYLIQSPGYITYRINDWIVASHKKFKNESYVAKKWPKTVTFFHRNVDGDSFQFAIEKYITDPQEIINEITKYIITNK